MDYNNLGAPSRWPTHHVTWGWPSDHLRTRPPRYYIYSDEEDGDHRYDIPISIATEIPHTDATLANSLIVIKMDTMSQDNGTAHHTEKFDLVEHGDLVVRRGQEFRITLTFNRSYSAASDMIRFNFTIGGQPLPGNETLVAFTADSKTPGDWEATILKTEGERVEVSIITAATCIVGEWRMVIDAITREHGSSKYIYKKPLYILFNPWCRKDSVYFPEEEKLTEYILNDSGCIFSGNYRQISATPWFFGQFEEGVLEAAIYCYTRAFNFRYGRTMADPVRVSRALSKIVNSNDERGVLVGKWSEPYQDGKAPWSWTGSVAILRQYANTQSPVKYGQCFVFSGVLTTICRALGLPCRSVTNYCSAHDTDASITIDQHWDINGSQDSALDNLDRDSIWNFHCWNDVWMKRPDLPPGYDGWQVVDATPQETSDGVFQCGPTSLNAVLHGKCELSYDAPFVFAEVNADIVHWGKDADGEWKLIRIDEKGVGKLISTKIPDGLPMPNCLSDCRSIREDVTHEYKYTDGSKKERLAVKRANRSAITRKILYKDGANDVTCELVPQDHTLIGADFVISVVLSNPGSYKRTVIGKLSCHSVTYTGERADNIKASNVQTVIAPSSEEILALPVSADDYQGHMTENAALKICFTGRVQETQQMLTLKDDFRLRIPELQLKILTEVSRVGAVLQCRVSFQNPLKSNNLTNCSLEVEGPGIKRTQSFKIGVIPPGREFVGILDLTPLKPGLRQIFVALNCDQLQDIKGIKEVFVYARGSTVYMD